MLQTQTYFPVLRRGHTDIGARCAEDRCERNKGTIPHHDQARNRQEWLSMVKMRASDAHSSRVISTAAARDTRIKAKGHAV